MPTACICLLVARPDDSPSVIQGKVRNERRRTAPLRLTSRRTIPAATPLSAIAPLWVIVEDRRLCVPALRRVCPCSTVAILPERCHVTYRASPHRRAGDRRSPAKAGDEKGTLRSGPKTWGLGPGSESIVRAHAHPCFDILAQAPRPGPSLIKQRAARSHAAGRAAYKPRRGAGRTACRRAG